MSAETNADELLAINQRLLDSIAAGDWLTYKELCDSTLTAFEPEACGQLVKGLQFHYFYFDHDDHRTRHQTTMVHPRVRLMGEAAVITYVRLNQRVGPDGQAHSAAYEETRIWQKQADGQWRHVHFHRSRAV
ncbi:MAG: DUF4440 domain-containing protein [Gemmataceae bacterium]